MLVLNTFAVFNAQLKNNYDALQGAAINAALASFNIGDYFPHSDAEFPLRNILAGVGLALAIFSAVLPLAAPVTSAFAAGAEAGAAAGASTGATLSAVSGFVANGVGASQDPLAVQKTYAPLVTDIYNSMVRRLNEVTNILFQGEPIGNTTIVDLIKNGARSTPFVPVNITSVERSMKIEILSRSIDALWKTYSSNKRWVTFLLLPTEDWNKTCQDHKGGPQDMKFCQVRSMSSY